MKKLLIYVIILALTLVICLNLFLFCNNSSLSNILNNSTNTRNTIIELDKFKTNITEMSDAKESFVLTGNSKYKENYETALDSTYNNADLLVDSNIISIEDKNTIVDLINALETFFNFQNNVEGIKEVRSQLIQNATLINYIRISSLNNSTINNKCQDCSNTLKSILDNLVEFEKLYSTNLSSIQLDIASYITKLKCSLNQLSSELSQLNEYNNYLLKLNNLLLNKETNN